MCVMKLVAISPQMRLVEDNVSSLSLLDIYKQQCTKRNVDPDAPINKYYEKLAAIQVSTVMGSPIFMIPLWSPLNAFLNGRSLIAITCCKNLTPYNSL